MSWTELIIGTIAGAIFRAVVWPDIWLALPRRHERRKQRRLEREEAERYGLARAAQVTRGLLGPRYPKIARPDIPSPAVDGPAGQRGNEWPSPPGTPPPGKLPASTPPARIYMPGHRAPLLDFSNLNRGGDVGRKAPAAMPKPPKIPPHTRVKS